MKNYEYIEGKEVTVVETNDGIQKEHKAVVSGCDYDIGITVEGLDDKGQKKILHLFTWSSSTQLQRHVVQRLRGFIQAEV